MFQTWQWVHVIIINGLGPAGPNHGLKFLSSVILNFQFYSAALGTFSLFMYMTYLFVQGVQRGAEGQPQQVLVRATYFSTRNPRLPNNIFFKVSDPPRENYYVRIGATLKHKWNIDIL